ncbi:globin-coupled sensor protein [Bradyrhizobium sp. dw_78]|uniref:globin-coupled sensor protein n=1 Tax=Bradyrhizobium sp. dw_78 TaxID=2719793 RepID=UPI001BD2B140|nr:globin-coupled sensor protein [Bradyrhizobium sp. dw_78]
MTNESTIAERLKFNNIDASTIAALAGSRAFILAEMPAILGRFYDHIEKFAETAAFFKSRDVMLHAKQMQLKHWAMIASGQFDEAYERSVTRIGEVHNTLGLEPRWYIGGYSALVAGLMEAIALRLPSSKFDRTAAARKAALQTAVIKASMLDMDLAISVYIEAGRRDRRQTLEDLASNFERAIGGVVDVVASAATGLQASAKTMSAAAKETAEQSNSVSRASEEASANVQTVAAATEELTNSITQISQQIKESARIAANAARNADETAAKINNLSEAAGRIGAIIDIITKIASQTNLLALNATIEAARAGDAGRGFAIVAQEVKSLAGQTARATAEISAQVGAMQSSTSESVHAIKEITGVIGSMNEVSAAIASAMEQQNSATREIASSIDQAAQGTGDVSTNITGVTRAAGETGSAAAQVLAASSELSQQSEGLRAEVDKFLRTVRAA